MVVHELVRGRQRRARLTRAVGLGAVAAVAAIAIGIVATNRRDARPLSLAERRNVAASLSAPVDHRPGCSCPFSRCEQGTCLSVCNETDFDFEHRWLVPGIKVDREQEAIIGVSLSEDELLYLGGKDCVLDRLMLARRAGPTYMPIDLTDRIDPSRAEIFEGCCTIAPDGASALLMGRDHQRFVRLSLSTMTVDEG